MKKSYEKKGKPMYMEVYDYYMNLIRKGKISENTRIPSVIECSKQLGVSRTTVENAYLALAADGYIISRPRSGFYVTDLVKKKAIRKMNSSGSKNTTACRFDFVTAGADPESFNFDLWRRYIKSALRQDSRLISYGEPQGESELREILASYAEKKRNVLCSPDNIVIGAGIQSILHILCPVINSSRKIIKFENDGFIQGEAVFRDHGWITEAENAQVIYVTPSHINNDGNVMDIRERSQLAGRASSEDILIIEDDYESEFTYSKRKYPSVQGIAAGENVVYAATFSRLLLPSIRMSFMVLPDDLMKKYSEISSFYNQTASKTEQIALCQFIRDGHLDSLIRKQKKMYRQKIQLLSELLSDEFGNSASIQDTDSDIHLRITFENSITPEELKKRAGENSILIRPFSDSRSGKTTAILSCTSVSSEDFSQVARLLKRSSRI